MAKGFSIHIGLNSVDPNHYNGWPGTLRACENDARDMERIARDCGYESITTLLTKDATSDKVFQAISQAASTLESGDILLYTYSGHGGQIPDVNGDEDDSLDETWCLFDRMLVDDELYRFWGLFKKGVRIVVISDSCHSGTVSKAIGDPVEFPPIIEDGQTIDYRLIPIDIRDATYNNNHIIYDAIQWGAPRGDIQSIGATVILISGCMDNQLSLDGSKNGAFTKQLLKIWDNGGFNGGYELFWKTVLSKMPKNQSPNYFIVGENNPSFESQKPFIIADSLSRSNPKSANQDFDLSSSGGFKSQQSEITSFVKVLLSEIGNQIAQYTLESLKSPDVLSRNTDRLQRNFPFSLYAPPLLYAPYTHILGNAQSLLLQIDYSPIGDAIVICEVRYRKYENLPLVEETVNSGGQIKTANSFDEVQLHFKGLVTGSGVQGSVTILN